MMRTPKGPSSRVRLGGYPLAGLAVLTLLTWLGLRGLPDGRLHVYFLDVGQGDAILIQSPDGRQVLVDGGPSPAALLGELGTILPFWDRSLDLVVLTHPDEDHSAGLLELLQRYKVAQIVDTSAAEKDASAAGSAWRAAVAGNGAKRLQAARGTEIRLDEVRLLVLNPANDTEHSTGGSDNNESIVLRLEYDQNCVLMTGDAEETVEVDLIDAGLLGPCDLLKVAHHGSKGATSAALLESVRPSLSVIQVGADNLYGHPHPEVLARLQASSRVLRTDLDGRIEAIGDGRKWQVSTNHRRSPDG